MGGPARHRFLGAVVLFAACLRPCAGMCNIEKYYGWYNMTKRGEQTELTNYMVKVDKQTGFWGVSEFLRYSPEPTYGQVMEKAAQICARSLSTLKRDLSGRHGDVTDWSIFGPMCSDECLDSDILHLEAMMQSGCNCLELSPQPGDVAYTREGEFCRRNSGRLLCDTLDRCGVWDCRLGDFMCPRHEFNKEWTRFRGFGDCSRGARAAALATLAALLAAANGLALLLPGGGAGPPRDD